MEMSGRTNVQADLEQPGDQAAVQFGVNGVKKVKKIKKAKKKPVANEEGQMPYDNNGFEGNDLVNKELREHDISPLHARPVGTAPNIAANTIDHPGSDKPAQPQEDDSIPHLDFDPNANAISNNAVHANAPLGQLPII